MDPIPVTLLTGHLGAGKTTLLNRLLAQPGWGDTAVIVNEAGAVDVDGGLVERVGDRAFATSTGCLCCTSSGDVRLTLLGLKDAADSGRGPAFCRVVIETTGLADPLPVIQTFLVQDIVLRAFRLSGVVAVADAATGAATLARFPEARRQVAVADLVLISKADLADPAPVMAAVAALAPAARVMDAGQATPADLFGAGGGPLPPLWRGAVGLGAAQAGGAGLHAATGVRSFAYLADRPVEARVIHLALAALQGHLGPDLLRVKGILALTGAAGRPAVIQAVQHLVAPFRHLPGWPAGIDGGRLVVIAAGDGAAQVPALMQALLPELRPLTGPGWGG